MKIRFSYVNLANIREKLRAINWKSRKTQSIVAIAVILFGAGIYGLFLRGSSEAPVAEQLRSVELVDVSSYAKLGSVEATGSGAREIVVRAEVGGKVTRVVPDGARVSLGQIVAELENSSQRAALLQAEGALDVAQAGLAKTRRGSRGEQQSILGTNVSSAESNLATAKEAAVTALTSAYATVEDAVQRKTDSMFSGAETGNARFLVPTSETQLALQAESQRVALTPILARQSEKVQTLTTTEDLIQELKRTEGELGAVRTYFGTLTPVLNKAISAGGYTETQLAMYRSDVSTARTNISTAISALTTARETLASRVAAVEVAQKNLEQGSTADEADVLTASASVKQAQGSYASALAAYQKTIIRASAPGTVIACSPDVGDVISTGADVCRIEATGGVLGSSFALPLSAVKYTPAGAYVFVVDESGKLQTKQVETGLVSADSIAVAGLFGDERIVKDIRGLKVGEKVEVVQ